MYYDRYKWRVTFSRQADAARIDEWFENNLSDPALAFPQKSRPRRAYLKGDAEAALVRLALSNDIASWREYSS